MKGFCKVCPVCNGNACVGEVPGMGGLGTSSSFKNNVNALANLKLNMRTIHDVTEPDTSVNIMGSETGYSSYRCTYRRSFIQHGWKN